MNLSQLAPLAQGGLESLSRNQDLLYRAGQVAGDGFAKIADKILDKLEARGLGQPDFNRHPARRLSAGLERLTTQLEKWDGDDNGVLDRKELTSGLKRLDNKIAELREDGVSGSEIKQLHELNQLKFAAKGLLRSYDKVSVLDGERGISKGDIVKLASLDGKDRHLSIRDFRALYRNTV